MRKRVVKTIRDILTAHLMEPEAVEVLRHSLVSLILYLNDDETSVVDLAFKTITEIFFTSSGPIDERLRKVLVERCKLFALAIGSAGDPKVKQSFQRFLSMLKKKNGSAQRFVDVLIFSLSDELVTESGLLILDYISTHFPALLSEHLDSLRPFMKPGKLEQVYFKFALLTMLG